MSPLEFDAQIEVNDLEYPASIDETDYSYEADLETVIVHTADKTFNFEQGVASARWEIQHNLKKFPSVTVVDSANNTVVGDVEYIDANNLVVTFSGAFSGKAFLN